jgi:replicative DNA helicase
MPPSTGNSDRVISSVELRAELAKLPVQIAFKTGMEGIDTLIGGFAEGDFIIISGAPKQGKSKYCMTLTKKFLKQDIPVLWFSVELPYPEFLTMFGKENANLYLPRQRNERTVDWIEKKIKEGVENYGVKIVFIDHLGLIRNEDLAKAFNSIDIMDARLDRLREIALKYKIVLIGTSEHDKESLKRGANVEMKSSGLRGTARLAYTASTILGIERLSASKTAKTWQDMEEEDGKLIQPEDMWVYVLDCRRTGTRKVRIRCFLNDEGDIEEYPRGGIASDLK